ncbi:ADP/ATP carrier protein [Spraguea lophii 42_110]|uniref:ADP,ATP carrier protein n=1 Tax=Spraguea lophii (strain 42_110) TaxID=1358809 RepID=S7WCH8_SPRLO|nr:ADP/ATP carrier protein [Spraguea lophii 42_110]
MDDDDHEQYENLNLPTETEVEEQAIARSRYFFGIYRIAKLEDAKLFTMGGIFFLICYVYSVTKELKDTFVIQRQTAISIQYLKLVFVPPIALLGTMIVAKMLVDHDNRYILQRFLMGFAIFFCLFSVLSFPFSFSLDFSTKSLEDSFADGKMKYKGTEFYIALITTVLSWTSTVLFVAAEVYGTIVLSLLFLSYANDICPLKQYLRFLPLLYIMSNIALIMSSFTLFGIGKAVGKLSYRTGKITFSVLFFSLGIACFATIFLINFLESKILSRPMFIVEGERKKKKKEKMSFSEGLKVVATSRVAMAICTIVIFYNLSQNMADNSYKSLLQKQKNIKGGGESYLMGNQWVSQLITGSCVIIVLLTPVSRVVQLAGWTIAGLMTPIYVILIGSIVFFLAMYNTGVVGQNGISFVNNFFSTHRFLHSFSKNKEDKYAIFDWEETIGKIFVAGGFKVLKYASFDICKEAISMKIDPRYRSRFKGVYDGICGKLGKSCGAILSIVFSAIFNITDIREASLVYFVTLIGIFVAWVLFVIYLGSKYNEAVEKNTFIDVGATSMDKEAKLA